MKPWLAFLYLGLLGWGASFMWIKIALEEVGPWTLVFYRVGIGVVGSWIAMLIMRIPVKLTRDQFKTLVLLGLVNSALPMTFISWAEIHISSGLAGMLNGTLPLFAIIFAHIFLDDDKITQSKLSGLVVGFAGMVVLLWDDIEHGLSGTTMGIVAMIGAVILYSIAGIITKKKLHGIPPALMTSVALSAALVFMFVMTLILESPIRIPGKPMTWVSLLWLGIFGMTLAYQALYYLFKVWPVSKISMITYVFPVTAIALGTIFLNEPLTWKLGLGGVLVFAGIAIVNFGGIRSKTPA